MDHWNDAILPQGVVDTHTHLEAIADDDAVGAVVVTHGHIDHLGGLRFVRRRTEAPVAVHVLDRRVLSRWEERVIVASKGRFDRARSAQQREKEGYPHASTMPVDEFMEATLDVWRIEPEGESRGIVVLAHGWSRNRDRMVPRARMFARMGFTTVIHSARDHGNSSRKRSMNAVKFAEDIEAVLQWVGEPVILYCHSAGSAGAIIACDWRVPP